VAAQALEDSALRFVDLTLIRSGPADGIQDGAVETTAQIGEGAVQLGEGFLLVLELPSQEDEALRIQALLCLNTRRWQEAQIALEEALALCRAMPYPYAEAKALYVYGRLCQVRGESKLAGERLGAALALLNRLGERLYAVQVERALADLGRS
jgi:tetratricopeptide (TPR) repeat protein